MFPFHNTQRSRALSIPRQYHRDRTIQEERFSVSDAVHLKLRIQNLDNALAYAPEDIDVDKIEQASQARPFHETTSPYVDGSEEFFLAVKPISRPDLIPEVYLEAYRAVLNRRPYVNSYRVSDFRKGVDPTFSEVIELLPAIDTICETDLAGAFSKLEAKAKPFAFLNLPAELRLQVYNELLPREKPLTLLNYDLRERRPYRPRLSIMRANRQLHDEVMKHMYKNRILFMSIARDKSSLNASNEYLSRLLVLLRSMNPATRQLFSHCELQIDYLSTHIPQEGRTTTCIHPLSPMDQIILLLSSLRKVKISFGVAPFASNSMATHRLVCERLETVDWLIECIPKNVEVEWDLTRAFATRFKTDERPLRRLVEKRGYILAESQPRSRA